MQNNIEMIIFLTIDFCDIIWLIAVYLTDTCTVSINSVFKRQNSIDMVSLK